jgi:adenosine deaminase
LRKMLEHNLAVTLCTDNRLVSNTSVCQEYALALDNFEINAKCLRNIVLCGFKRSFYYRPYREKRALVSSVGNYYDTLFQKFAITD